MIEASAISDIVTNVAQMGFSFAMCAAMFWKMVKQDEAHAKQISEQDKRYDEQISRLTEVITGNTVALTQLKDKITEVSK